MAIAESAGASLPGRFLYPDEGAPETIDGEEYAAGQNLNRQSGRGAINKKASTLIKQPRCRGAIFHCARTFGGGQDLIPGKKTR